MREIRELEKRLRNIEKEHNKLRRVRSSYGRSATNPRPYLAERISARFRPQTAPEQALIKRLLNKESNFSESASLDFGSSANVPGEIVSRNEETFSSSTGECDRFTKFHDSGSKIEQRWDKDSPPKSQFNKSASKYATDGRPTSGNEVIRERASRKTSSKTSFRSASLHMSVRSTNSHKSGRSDLPSHEMTQKIDPWVCKSMPLHPERQSIYTMVIPPARSAEKSKNDCFKNSQGKKINPKNRIPFTDLHSYKRTLRFQGNPRNVNVIHTDENPGIELEFQRLKHCRYLRNPDFSTKRRHVHVPTHVSQLPRFGTDNHGLSGPISLGNV